MVEAAFTLQPEFQAAHRAHVRAQRIHTGKVASALVVFLMPAGVVLDYYVYPGEVIPFLWIRLFGSALGLVLWALHASEFGQKHVRWLGLPIPFVPAACVAWMIYRTGDPASPYYAGLNLILLAVSVVGHWTFIESLVVVGGVALMYLAAAFGQSGAVNDWTEFWRGFVNNLYFLILTGIIVVTGNHFYNRLLFREFCLAFELEQNKQQLEESNRKLTEMDQIKGRFFANISHELRTPLTLMISPLETILARYRGTLPSDAVGLMQTMHSNGLRLLKLINDLLDLVRLDSGVMQVKREPVALDQFLRHMAGAARQLAEDKRIELVVTAPDLGLVMVDRDKLEKIILNLQFNALKFTPAGGRVELRLEREGDEIVLKVSDTGIGIPKDKLPQMFQRFMQVDTSSRRKYQGVGIGLALVKELVEVHGGQVSVESVEGKGSTFIVRLPYVAAPVDAVPMSSDTPSPLAAAKTAPGADTTTAAPAAGATANQEWLTDLYHRANLFGSQSVERSAAASSERPASTHARTVLIADDQPDMLRFIKSELAPHYNIIEATDGQQAVDKAAAFTPDIILLDMMMPEKDGIQAAREIRAAPATQNVPIVLITAHVDEETKLGALRAGASDFLPKPFSTTELHVRVKNLVESHDFQRRLAAQNKQLEDALRQLKETELQLVQTEKIVSLGRLSAGIIHEINNPLNFAATGLYVLKNQGQRLAADEPKEFADILRDIEDGIQRVKNIVADLRSFTHPDTRQQESVRVSEVVTSSLRLLSNEWRDKVQIDQSVPPDLVCLANKNKLTQVFVNLIQNSLDALKHKPEGPEPPLIRLRGHRTDGKVVLTIRDNGEGIDPQHLPKVFDPFFTTRDVGQGMGMGLSICYRIIQELHGNISVASERGKFSEFTIELPAAASESIAA